MKRRVGLAALFILLLSCIVFYNNCGSFLFTGVTHETAIGNPKNPTDSSQEILFVLCSVLDRCSQVPFNSCMTGIQNVNGIGSRLGLPPGVDDPFSSLASAESSGAIVANLTATNTCADTINNLSCSDPTVIGAYNSLSSTPFANMATMIPLQQCSTVFTQSSCPGVPAQGFFVNDLTDAPDATPGDQICSTASGTCTLRAAIMEANADGGTNNVILPPGTISLASSLPLSSNINIYGSCNGQTIVDGQSSVKLFGVTKTNLSISMQSLKLQNGLNSGGNGGAIDNGFNSGLIFNGSYLNFYNNKATGANGGGAVFWWGAGSIFNCSDCIFDSNQATVGTDGGAVCAVGSANYQRCLFVNNSSNNGGAAYDEGNSTYTNCTFASNTAAVDGGAVYTHASGDIFINNTFVNNKAIAPGSYGALRANANSTVTMANNLLYNNSGTNGTCGILAMTSNGGNLSYPPAGGCSFNQPTDLSVAPTLGPLQNNGGFSSTMALLPGSPGIDAGVTSLCPPVDQRSTSRLNDGQCDIGAYESQP